MRLYLIDDDPIFIFLIKKTIEKTNFQPEIEVFGDGETAINHIKEIKDNRDLLPDIILLDLNMPVLDGWGFADEFTKISGELPKNINIYMVSSSISPHDIEKSRTYSVVTDFMIKPITSEKLNEIFNKTNT